MSNRNIQALMQDIIARIYYTQMETVVGPLYIAFQGGVATLLLISFDDEQAFLLQAQRLFKMEPVKAADPPEILIQQIQESVVRGTAFQGNIDFSYLSELQQKTLKYILQVPEGQLLSYRDVAQRIGYPTKVVEEIVASNPLPIVVPCHRVAQSNGTLGIYVGGRLDVKKDLLYRAGFSVSKYWRREVLTEINPGTYTRRILKQRDGYTFPQYNSGPGKLLGFLRFYKKYAHRHVEEQYAEWLIRRYQELDGIGESLTDKKVPLEEIYSTPHISVSSSPRGERSRIEAQIMEAANAGSENESLSTGLEWVNGLADVVRRHNCIVLLGEPGSGKTAALQYLALQQAKKLLNQHDTDRSQLLLPIPLRLTDYVKEGYPRDKALIYFVRDYLAKRCSINKRQLIDLIQTRFIEGSCLFLLDGFDDITDPDKQLQLIRHINRITYLHRNSGNRFVVTSRLIGAHNAFSNQFVYGKLHGMDIEEISYLLQRWCEVLLANKVDLRPRPSKQQLLETLIFLLQMTYEYMKADQQYQGSITPLFVQIVVAIYYSVMQRIPPDIAKLISADIPWEGSPQDRLIAFFSQYIYTRYSTQHIDVSQSITEALTEVNASKRAWEDYRIVTHPSRYRHESIHRNRIVYEKLRRGWKGIRQIWDDEAMHLAVDI